LPCPRCLAMAPSEDPIPASSIPDLLSSAEVEQIFGRSARTLRRWEQSGHLVPIPVGSAKFYRAEDVRRLIADQVEKTMLSRTTAGKTDPGDPS
jgi:hypothetical protein